MSESKSQGLLLNLNLPILWFNNIIRCDVINLGLSTLTLTLYSTEILNLWLKIPD